MTGLAVDAPAGRLHNKNMQNKKRATAKRVDWHHRELLRPAEVAELIGESRSGVYSRIARGQLPAIRLGKSVRVPRIKLEEMLAELIAGRPDGGVAA